MKWERIHTTYNECLLKNLSVLLDSKATYYVGFICLMHHFKNWTVLASWFNQNWMCFWSGLPQICMYGQTEFRLLKNIVNWLTDAHFQEPVELHS